jgi:hypothetical protein
VEAENLTKSDVYISRRLAATTYGNITCKILDFHTDYYHNIVGELSNPNDAVCQPGEAQAGWQEVMGDRETEWVRQAPQPW